MKREMNMILKAVVLPLLAAAFCSCALGETDVMSSLDEEPVANYQVMGTVRDEADAPVYGIRVIADYTDYTDYSSLTVYRADTLYTDREGRFSKFLSAPHVAMFSLTFTDVDGQANGGGFKPKTLNVKPFRTEMASGLRGGSFIVSADVVMER